MPDDEALKAARWVAGFSTVPEEWSGEPHDVTEDPPPGLRDIEANAAVANADTWDRVLSKLEGSERDWLWALKDAVDQLARELGRG